MVTLTADELFGGTCAPIVVREYCFHTAPEAVAAEAVKIVFTLSGCGEIQSGQERMPLSAGSIFAVSANQLCRALPVLHTRAVSFYVQQDFLRAQLRWLPSTHPLVHRLHGATSRGARLQHLQLHRAAMEQLVPRLLLLAQLPQRADDELCRLALAASVFDAVGKLAGDDLSSDPAALENQRMPQSEVAAVVAAMHEHMDAPWRVEDLARLAALSPSQLGRLFRAQIGTSPAAYLARLRAERMAELLATTHLSVAEAARAVGWEDASVASRAFRRRYGISPREFIASECHAAGPPAE